MDALTTYPLVIERPAGEPPVRGEVIFAEAWDAALDDVPPGNDFRIVMLMRPPASGSIGVSNAAIAVLAPGGSSRVAEAATTYAPGGPGAVPTPGREFAAALASGRVITAEPIPLDDVFGEGGPRWAMLAERLTQSARRAPARRAIALALECEPAAVDAQFGQLLRLSAGAGDGFGEALARLRAVDASEPPRSSPAQVADDVFALRAWLAAPDAARGLQRMRGFVADAAVPGDDARFADLALDRAITREQLSFGALVATPHRLAAIEAAFEYFARRYGTVYERHHAGYHDSVRSLAGEVAAVEDDARALRLLNTIDGLGPALGAAALAELAALQQAIVPCTATRPPDAARCPGCRIALDDAPPVAATADVRARVRRALQGQQRRLARETVGRLLEQRGGDRIERFLRVVQASDVGALTSALDERLVAFLRDLLADAPPRVELAPVLAAVAERFGEVGADEIDTVVAALRDALAAALQPVAADTAGPAHVALASQ